MPPTAAAMADVGTFTALVRAAPLRNGGFLFEPGEACKRVVGVPVDVAQLVIPDWPPLGHVRRGWEAITPEERADVASRVADALQGASWPTERRDALLHFFTFLAQVETIAIEIPLRFLPTAPAHLRPLLQRQLVDEVFHSTLFARIAHELALPAARPPAPLPSAEALLDRIRHEPDLAITATLLNVVAEGWIETLFKHALRWGVADHVFATVLRDEARHVHEAKAYVAGMDRDKAQAAVRTFERGMMQVSAEPTVALSILDLAGEANQRALGLELAQQHRRHLAEVGLEPSQEWQDAMAAASRAVASMPERPVGPSPAPDTEWRRLARQVWLPPRDPTMQGDFDVPIGHVPRKAITPVIIAALGQAWAENPVLNRVIARGGPWQLPHANVGVRVLLEDNELATVVIPEADRRSISDIRRMLADGVLQLQRGRQRAKESGVRAVFDAQAASLAPPSAHLYSVGLSNAGKWGLVAGAGAFVGWLSPSSDITVGVRRKLPRWRGLAYLPAWHVNFGCIQDHRVFDGHESAVAVTSILKALSKASVRAILRRPDTVEPDAEKDRERWLAQAMPPEMRILASVALPKYMPIALGGLGLGAVGAAGAYMYAQEKAEERRARDAQASAAAAAPAPTPPTVPKEAAPRAPPRPPASPGRPGPAGATAKKAPKKTPKDAPRKPPRSGKGGK